MVKKDRKQKTSKRKLLKQERLKREKQKRLLTLVSIVGIALVLIGFVIIPTVHTSLNPIGDYVQITPESIPLAEGTAIGDPNSAIKIEVFEDFKCSACRNYTERIEPLVISNHASKGEIYYVIYNYPFLDDESPTKDSDRAATASQCAAEQNRFWDFHKMLYANLNFTPNEFSEERMLAFADALNLNMEKFTECFENNAVQAIIDENLNKGPEMGVTGTPSIYINGVNIKPGVVPTYEEIKAAIEADLNETGG
jgi:protein-disulfide isomerase